MTNIQWRVLIGIAAAVVAFLLIQTEVTFDPIAHVALGAIAVALSVINVPDEGTKRGA